MENGWYHIMVFVDRSGKSDIFLNGMKYTTRYDKLIARAKMFINRYVICIKMKAIKYKLWYPKSEKKEKEENVEIEEINFSSGDIFSLYAKDGEKKVVDNVDYIFEHVFKIKEKP